MHRRKSDTCPGPRELRSEQNPSAVSKRLMERRGVRRWVGWDGGAVGTESRGVSRYREDRRGGKHCVKPSGGDIWEAFWISWICHCLYTTFVYPSIWPWTVGLFPPCGYCEVMTRSTLVYKCLCESLLSVLLSVYPEVNLLAHRVILCLIFLRSNHTVCICF